MFDRSCVSQLGMRGISCKQFSLQSASRGCIRSCRLLFRCTGGVAWASSRCSSSPRFDPPGSTRCRQRHSSPFRSWLGLRSAPHQHIVDLVLPSRPDVVVERVDIWRICRESWREQCRRGRPVRCITAPISCHGGAVTGRPVFLHDEIHANLRCRLRNVVMSREPVVFRRCHFHSGRHEMRLPDPTVQCGTSSNDDAFMNLPPSRATMLGFKSRFR